MKRTIIAFAMILLLSLVSLLGFGCDSATGGGPIPTPAGSAAPPPAVGEPIVIAFLIGGEGDGWQEHFPYLTKLLGDRGWNMQFKSRPMASGDIPEQIADAVKADMAAGIAADGYVMQAADGEQLVKDGVAQDVAPIVQSAAPALYGAYRPFFEESRAGLPLWLQRYKKGRPLAFFLRAELAQGRDIAAMSDVMALLRDNPDRAIAADSGMFGSIDISSIYDGWAGEQGYYPLELYGVVGSFYAAMDDRTCAPVPVEKLPGFEDFYRQAVGYYLDRRIVSLWDEERLPRPSILGYVGRLDLEMDTGFLAAQQAVGDDFVAFPLLGGSAPALPAEQSAVAGVLAVPATSGKAAQLAAFVQWVLLDDGGYDLVSYGEPDRDYRIVNGRVQYLSEGVPMALKDRYGLMNARYEKGLGALFFLDDGNRPTVYSACNYESVQAGNPSADQPVWRIGRLREMWPYQCVEVFEEIIQQQNELISDRSMLLGGSVPGTSSDDDGPRVEQCLNRLRELEPQTAALAQAYWERIRELEEQEE